MDEGSEADGEDAGIVTRRAVWNRRALTMRLDGHSSQSLVFAGILIAK